jgi:hypothetical protein
MINELIRQERLAAAFPEPAAATSATAAAPPTPPAANSHDLTAAWAVLQTPNQIKDVDALAAALDDLGIYNEADLQDVLNVDVELVKGVVTFLKPAGVSKFKRALGFL